MFNIIRAIHPLAKVKEFPGQFHTNFDNDHTFKRNRLFLYDVHEKLE